jgi:hypothetical protein
LLTCCISNETSRNEAALYERLKNKPLTLKEKETANHLKKSGFYNVEIYPPTIGIDAQGTSFYSIILFSKTRTSQIPTERIKSIQYETAKHFFLDVIEDSILYDIGEISVTLSLRSKIKFGSDVKFYNSYSKKQLEKALNFKVIRKDDYTFERVTLEEFNTVN